MSLALPRPAIPTGVTLGALWMVGFALLAPWLDVFAKLAAATLPLGVIVLARFSVQASALGLLILATGRRLPPLRDLPWHVAIGASLAGATLFFFGAIRHMPIAEAIAIFFVEPLLLTLLSALFLGEKVGWRRWAGCAAGFAGVLLVVRPSFAEVGTPALFPLGTACLFALYMLMTRKLSVRTDAVSMQFVSGVSGASVVAVALLVGTGSGTDFDARLPAGAEWGMLFGVGVFATLAHLCIVLALRHAPASVVAPVQYLEIATATLYGWWVFGDLPAPAAWAGIALIAGSGLYVLHRERRVQRRALAGSVGPGAPLA